MVKDSKVPRYPRVIFITVAACISKEREECPAFSPLTEDKRCLSKNLLRKRKKVQAVTPTLFFLKGNYEKNSQSNLCGGQSFSSKLHGAHSYAFNPCIVSEIFTQCPELSRHQSPGWSITPADKGIHFHSLQSPNCALSLMLPALARIQRNVNVISHQPVRIHKDDHAPLAGPPCWWAASVTYLWVTLPWRGQCKGLPERWVYCRSDQSRWLPRAPAPPEFCHWHPWSPQTAVWAKRLRERERNHYFKNQNKVPQGEYVLSIILWAFGDIQTLVFMGCHQDENRN